MKLRNRTHYVIPKKWLSSILSSLKINPNVLIEYADNPKKISKPNYKHKFGAKYHDLDGLAVGNRVYLYCGKYVKGKYREYTLGFVQWILAHELRHVYYYNQPEEELPWKNCTKKQREKREELACSLYANKMMEVRKRADLPRFTNNAEGKI